MKAFPLFITVANRPLVVFGGGEEAAAKIRLLLKTEAFVVAVASDFEPSVAGLEGLTRVRQNPLCYTIPHGTPFVYAATGDLQLDADLARQTRAAGVLVCAADQPSASDFATPAIVDRDPVVVAIGTEGTAPVLARSIKAQIEFLLEPGLGLIARTAAGLRKQVARTLAPGQARRTFWRRFFSAARDQRLGSPDALQALSRQLLSDTAKAAATPPAGGLTIVGTGDGDADFLAVAGHRALDTAGVVLHDPLVARSILELARREAVLQVLPIGSTREILRHVAAGEQVVRLVSGTGSAAMKEFEDAKAAGIPVRLIPGLEALNDHRSLTPQPAKTARILPPLLSRKAA